MGAYDGVLEYYLDYSERELEPAEFDNVDGRDAGFGIFNATGAIRYGGYPDNPKCISHYPDAYRKLANAGKKIALVHQVAYNDFLGGRDAGRRHAEILKADGKRIGYPDTGHPYFFAFDRKLPGNPATGITPTNLDTVYAYIEGTKDVVGYNDSGLYGFLDVIHPAIRDNLTRHRWLCGAGSSVIPGVSAWQYNNGYVYPGQPAMQADVNLIYTDMFGQSEGDDFLMGLQQWQQERVFDRIIKMSAGVAGENFDGAQFVHENNQRLAIMTALQAQNAVLLQLVEKSSNVTLTPAQLEALKTNLNTAIAKEIGDAEAALTAHIDAMSTMLAAKLGASKDTTMAALNEFFGRAVKS